MREAQGARATGVLRVRLGSRDLVPDDHVLARVDRVLDLVAARGGRQSLRRGRRLARDRSGGGGPADAGGLASLGIVHDRRLMREARG